MRILRLLAAFGCALPASAAAQVEVMYKLTCSPALDLFQLERFVADYSRGPEQVNREIEYANLSSTTGIYRFPTGGSRRHRCAVGRGRNFELSVEGLRLDLRYGGDYMLQDFRLDPTKGGSAVILSRITYSNATSQYVEICTREQTCETLILDEAEFPFSIE